MRTFFSRNIFLQTIKKLSLLSILSALLSCLVTSTLIHSNYLGSFRKFIVFDLNYNFYGNDGYTALGNAPILLFVMFFTSAILTYAAFSFQNKRNASDKEHSLPYTHTQQFVSRIAAVLLLTYSIIIVTMLISWLSIISVGSIYTGSYMIMGALGYMAGSTLIVSAVALAMCFTGTAFSGFSAAVVILFLPRCILFIIGILITKVSYSIINLNELNVFLNPSTHIPAAVLLDMFELWQYNGISETLISVKSIIFTFALAMIYLAAAVIFSNRRKSELAGKSFEKSWMSYFFAALCTMPLLAYSGYIIASNLIYFAGFWNAVSKSSVVLALFAVIIFAVLAVIYTGKINGLLKGLLIFAVAGAAAYIAIIGGFLAAHSYTHKSIDYENVDYLTINISTDIAYRSNPTCTYGILKSKDVKLYDEDLIKILSESLDTVIENIDSIPQNSYPVYSRYNFWCEFHMKSGRTITRNIPVYIDDDAEKIVEMLLNNEAYHTALYSLPGYDEIETGWLYYPISIEQESDAIELYKTFYDEEMQNENTTRQVLSYYLRDFTAYSTTAYEFSRFTVSGKIKEGKFINRFDITSDYPNTINMYMSTINESEQIAEMNQIIDEIIAINIGDIKLDFNLVFFDKKIGILRSIYYERIHSQSNISSDELIEILKYYKSMEAEIYSEYTMYADIQFYFYPNENNEYESVRTYLPLTDEMYERIIELSRNEQ